MRLPALSHIEGQVIFQRECSVVCQYLRYRLESRPDDEGLRPMYSPSSPPFSCAAWAASAASTCAWSSIMAVEDSCAAMTISLFGMRGRCVLLSALVLCILPITIEQAAVARWLYAAGMEQFSSSGANKSGV
jgi:hypothetical protein